MKQIYESYRFIYENQTEERGRAPVEEDRLIEEARQGNVTAYGELIKIYSPIVERFAFQMGHRYQDIPDISQEVFIRVYRFLDQFSRAKFTTWLYKITLNVSRDYFRKEGQHHRRVELMKNEPNELQHSVDAEGSLLREEEDQQLHQCIQTLDEKYRLPIILFYFHEKKYEEISDILNITLSTVKTRILRGKSQLKKALEEAEKKEGKQNG